MFSIIFEVKITYSSIQNGAFRIRYREVRSYVPTYLGSTNMPTTLVICIIMRMGLKRLSLCLSTLKKNFRGQFSTNSKGYEFQ